MSKEVFVTLPFDCFETKYDEDGSPIVFRPPSCWYFLNALGEYVFIKKTSRLDAQSLVDSEYGKDKYTIRAAYNKTKSGSSSYTVRGVATRKGQKKY